MLCLSCLSVTFELSKKKNIINFTVIYLLLTEVLLLGAADIQRNWREIWSRVF